MKIEEFLKKYDRQGVIVLLEGKRDVLEEDKAKLKKLGRLLAEKSDKMMFRSGNASGADQWFSEGVASADHKRLQVITPYFGHRKKSNPAYDTIALDTIDIANEPEVVYHSRSNKKTEKLIDKYVEGDKNRFTMKAAYIIRDTVKVIGTKDIGPAAFGIFYDDLEDPRSGGTGHTMNICIRNNIPIIDQRVWFKWLIE
jgi:hypothetical protein